MYTLFPYTTRFRSQTRLRSFATLRHGGRRGNIAHRHVSALDRSRAVARRLCAAIPPSQGWPIRQESESPAALLPIRSEEHTSELQSLKRISNAIFCLKKNKQHNQHRS